MVLRSTRITDRKARDALVKHNTREAVVAGKAIWILSKRLDRTPQSRLRSAQPNWGITMHSRLTLEAELLHLLGRGRDAHIAARYYGFDGHGRRTLRDVGNEVGLTAERVRQIVSAASESLSARRPPSPVLDRTIEFVVDRMPAPAGEIEVKLRSERLTSGLFRLEGVIKAAKVLGRPLPFSISKGEEGRLVHAPNIPPVYTIVRIARRLVSCSGIATPSNIVTEVNKVGSGVCDGKLVASVLACHGEFRLLERSGGWVLSKDGGTLTAPRPEVMVHLEHTLESELLDLLGTGRKACIAARYYGFDGRGGGSLQSIGNEAGLTRERIRQIVAEASKGVSAGQPVAPMLDRTIEFVARCMPAPAGEIEAKLPSQGLTSGLFRLEGVIEAADLLGKRLPFSISQLGGERLVHARDIGSVDSIVCIARRVVCRWGIVTLSKVVAEVRKFKSGLCNKKLVVGVLTCLRGFHWLDQSAGWFWLSDAPDNPVLSRMRKILSVANPIQISELWAGVARDYRMKGYSPPKRVLLEFCRQARGLRVNDEIVKAEPGIRADDVLAQTERDIVQMLSEHGGIMATSEFKSVCRGTSLNTNTFYQILLRSPIISRYNDHVYGLIGSRERSGRRGTLFIPTGVCTDTSAPKGISSTGDCLFR